MVGFGEARGAMKFLKDQVRKALGLIEELQRLPIWLTEEVRRRRASVIEEATCAQLQATSIRELGQGLPFGMLENAGVSSVQQVLDAPMRDLIRIEGLGAGAAAQIRALAEVHSEAVRSKVREMPDPDHRRVGDTSLLQSILAYSDFRQKVEPELASLSQEGRRLAGAAAELRGQNGLLAMAFSRDKRRVAVEGASAAARDVGKLTRRLESALALGDPTKVEPKEAWDLYQRNTAPFIAALETAVAGPVAVQPTRRAEAKRVAARVLKPLQRPSGQVAVPANEALPPAVALPPIDLKQTGGVPPELAARIEASVLLRGPLTASLRRYQEFGARFLAHQGRAILGDDMGLGKTVQVLALMCHLHALGARRFLVVAPNSLLINWERETGKHTRLRPLILHGDSRYQQVRDWMRNGGVAITTYGTLGALVGHLTSVDLLVADEAHYAKNPGSKRSQAIEVVASKASRVALLTGTAIENRLSELGSLVGLANPGLSELVKHLVEHEEPDPAETRKMLAPVYLRRLQTDVLKELPDRNEVCEWIEFTPDDGNAYRTAEAAGDLMTVRHAASVGCGTAASAKMQRLRELFDNYRTLGRKVVVFSYFRQTLDLVSSLAGGCEQIHGEASAADRQAVIDRFGSRNGFAVIASQIEAGGIGLNIQAAQVVIIMEPQLKPSTESQAIARVHRMGQSRMVTVHRMIAKGSIEEWATSLLEEKRKIFRSYADPSALKEVSAMAMDPSRTSIEHDLGAMLRRQQSHSQPGNPPARLVATS
jgi:superfamily II DNA or RNA helicase